jgi:hypothetical protein
VCVFSSTFQFCAAVLCRPSTRRFARPAFFFVAEIFCSYVFFVPNDAASRRLAETRRDFWSSDAVVPRSGVRLSCYGCGVFGVLLFDNRDFSRFFFFVDRLPQADVSCRGADHQRDWQLGRRLPRGHWHRSVRKRKWWFVTGGSIFAR